MGNEANVPAFFSALALVASGALAGLTARAEQADLRRAKRWWLIGALLVFMAFDEAAGIHELLDPIGSRRPTDGILYYAWVVPYAGLVLAVAAYLFPFWWQLPTRTRLGLAVAASVYCAGAMGMELLQGAFVAEAGKAAAYGTLKMNVYITIEEGAEMLGLAWRCSCARSCGILRRQRFRKRCCGSRARGRVPLNL